MYKNYTNWFVKAMKRSQSYSSWVQCRCAYWLLSSLWSGTTQGEFPRGCSSFCFWCKKLPWLQGGNFKNEVTTTPKDLAFCMQALWIWRDQKQKNGTNVMAMFTVSCPYHVYRSTTKTWPLRECHHSPINTDTFTLLTPDHLCFLDKKGLLETIVAKLKWLECPLCSTAVVSTDF